MSIAHLITRRVVTVDMDDTLKAIRDIFNHVRFHHVLVVNGKRLVGVISDRDLLRAVSPFIGTMLETQRDEATLNKRAHQIMTRKPVTVTVDISVREAITTMLNRNVSCLPVLTAGGEIEGVLTWKDIGRSLLAEEHADAYRSPFSPS